MHWCGVLQHCSDPGSPFTAREVQQWGCDHGILWSDHVPYHPEASVLIERWNGFLKTQLQPQLGGSRKVSLLFSWRGSETFRVEDVGEAGERAASDRERKSNLLLTPRAPVWEHTSKSRSTVAWGQLEDLGNKSCPQYTFSVLRRSRDSSGPLLLGQKIGVLPVDPAPWSNVNSSILSEQKGTCCRLGPLFLCF